MDEGFGSVRDLYEKEFDGISLWFQNEGTTEQTRNYKNYNSCTAPFPKYEFQIDLMDVSSLLRDVGVEIGEQPKFGMVCIDIFSKKLHVVPMKTNDTGTVFDAMMECFKVLGQPLMMYSDDEGALNSKKVQDFFKGEGITHIITKTHANQAERVIRSLKNMIADRLRANRDKTWVEMLQCARAGGRKIENTPIHRPRGAPRAIGAGVRQYTDTPTQGDPASDRRRIAAIHRYTDRGSAAIHRYTDPGGPRERSAQECGNTPIHRPRATPRAIGAGLRQYTDTPTGGVRQYTDTPTQGGPASDRRRSAAIHRYTDPGGPRERSAQDCSNTPIHRPGGAPRAIGAGVRQYTDTPTQGDPASDRRRTAAIHRYTDPRGAPRAIGAGLRQYTDTPTQGDPRARHYTDTLTQGDPRAIGAGLL